MKSRAGSRTSGTARRSTTVRPRKGGRGRATPAASARRAKPRGRRADAPSTQEIAARAYQRYLERDGREGSAEGDWLAAEAEVIGRRGRS